MHLQHQRNATVVVAVTAVLVVIGVAVLGWYAADHLRDRDGNPAIPGSSGTDPRLKHVYAAWKKQFGREPTEEELRTSVQTVLKSMQTMETVAAGAGIRLEPGEAWEVVTCPYCDGRGKHASRSTRTCDICGGNRLVGFAACLECKGRGFVYVKDSWDCGCCKGKGSLAKISILLYRKTYGPPMRIRLKSQP